MDLQEFRPYPSVLPRLEASGNRAPDPPLFTRHRPEGRPRCRPPGPDAAGRGEVQGGGASPGAPAPAGDGFGGGDLIGLLVALAVAALLWAGTLSALGGARSRTPQQPAPPYDTEDFFRPR
jgi:hypothetical protein